MVSSKFLQATYPGCEPIVPCGPPTLVPWHTVNVADERMIFSCGDGDDDDDDDDNATVSYFSSVFPALSFYARVLM